MNNILRIDTPLASASISVTDKTKAIILCFLGTGILVAGLVMLSQSKN